MRKRSASMMILALALGQLPSTILAQGSLTPPGAPAPTMKTLEQLDAKLEKRTAITSLPAFIGNSGSYYLATNLTGSSGQYGIEIAARDVTIDLNGFSLSGVPGSLKGVLAGSGCRNVIVRNGSIIGWGGDGIGTFEDISILRLESLQLRSNSGSGIRILGSGQVTDCMAFGNGAQGIEAGEVSVVARCLATRNSGTGITVGGASRVNDCTAQGNVVHGINAGTRSSVRDCIAVENTGDGIRAFSQCVILKNLCSGNGNGGDGAGIHAVGNNNRIEENLVSGNDRGIDVDLGGSLIIKNSSSGNTTHYDLNASSTFGPIVSGEDLSVPVNGSHPWANFIH